jgi:hypothetical protein
MASHNISQKERQNCNSGKHSSASCLLECILIDFLLKGKTIYMACYVQKLKKLWHALHEKHPQKRTSTQQYMMSHCTSDTGGNYKACLEVFLYPLYSPDLEPSDYHMKHHMTGQHYKNDNTILDTMCRWLQDVGTDIYHSRIFKLKKCWQKNMDYCGDFAEK